MKIYLVRHGKTESNKSGTFYGATDEPISTEGHDDLMRKRVIYKGLKFDYGYCSPLKRAVQTFEVLFPNQKIDEMRDDIMEMDFGDWSKRSINDIIKEYSGLGYNLNNFAEPPNGETYQDLYQRTSGFTDEIINKHQDDEMVVAVSHGMAIAAMVDKLGFFEDKSLLELTPDNGLGYIIDVKDKKVKNIEIIKG